MTPQRVPLPSLCEGRLQISALSMKLYSGPSRRRHSELLPNLLLLDHRRPKLRRFLQYVKKRTSAVDSIPLRIGDRLENAGPLQPLDRALHRRKSQLQLHSGSSNRQEWIGRQQIDHAQRSRCGFVASASCKAHRSNARTLHHDLTRCRQHGACPTRASSAPRCS
jgi:hypothetical protein